MTVMIFERVPASLRGELTRWMLEPRAGVFVGRLSAMVRERLWAYACGKLKGGGGMLVYASDAEQGYTLEYAGEPGRRVRDFDGLWLIEV